MRHGSHIDPPNRFDRVHVEPDVEHLEGDDDFRDGPADRPVEYLSDASRTIVSHNDSPDVPFRYSVNPYRGCTHGCAYCYARPGHEYLGHSAGLDFETKIFVKHDAPALLRAFLSRAAWQPEPISFCGVTDPLSRPSGTSGSPGAAWRWRLSSGSPSALSPKMPWWCATSICWAPWPPCGWLT